MTRLALNAIRSAVSMFNAGYSVAAIQQRQKEEVVVTKRSLYRLIKKFKEKGVYNKNKRPYYYSKFVELLARIFFQARVRAH